MSSGQRPTIAALFVDRDGTLIQEFRSHITSPGQVRIQHAVARALREVALPTYCVTNQSVIGRGEQTAASVSAVNARVAERCGRLGAVIGAFLVCPHAPWDECECRKPAPGLFQRARREYEVTLERSLMIGNRLLDAQAAAAAGCAASLLIDNGKLRAELRDAPLPARTEIVEANRLASVLGRWTGPG